MFKAIIRHLYPGTDNAFVSRHCQQPCIVVQLNKNGKRKKINFTFKIVDVKAVTDVDIGPIKENAFLFAKRHDDAI